MPTRLHLPARRPAVALSSVIGLAAATVIGAAAPASASPDAQTTVAQWDVAAATLGTAGSLWEPMQTAGLDRSRPIRVQAEGLAFANGAVTSGATAVSTRYGTGGFRLWVDEKWADTGWAVAPVTERASRPVGTVRILIGEPGTQTAVTAVVSANCAQRSMGTAARARLPQRCSRSDVLRYGGSLAMTARPASTMTGPGTTTIRLRSTGLRYSELVDVARGLQQVAGTPTVAGSAQMVAMCRQMVDGRMTSAQATAFAVAEGYTARVGSIDGQSLAVTADYRPDRFTLAVAADAVVSCTYG